MEYTNLKMQQLINTALSLVAANKGLLAMDESTPTCNKRFDQFGIPQTEEARRSYRELIVTTPGLNEYISGAILYDETTKQHTLEGWSFVDILIVAGIIPGIKVDMGTTDLAGFPGEKITEGLDGLRDRLEQYATEKFRFAKWRAVLSMGSDKPSVGCIAANMQALARYAALCQEAGLVPIVEPELLMDGNHTMQQCYEVTERVLNELFNQLHKQRVALEGILLKPNMVLPGLDAIEQNSTEEIATATVNCLTSAVPAAVPGIAFLSGGQGSERASARLNEMNKKYRGQVPWQLTFSFSRALQLPALKIWGGKDPNKEKAQQALLHRAKCNSAARSGHYTMAMERSMIY